MTIAYPPRPTTQRVVLTVPCEIGAQSNDSHIETTTHHIKVHRPFVNYFIQSLIVSSGWYSSERHRSPPIIPVASPKIGKKPVVNSVNEEQPVYLPSRHGAFYLTESRAPNNEKGPFSACEALRTGNHLGYAKSGPESFWKVG